MLLGLAVACGASTHALSDEELSPPEAHRLAAAGLVILIDVRRPDEWFETGVPEHAHAVQMGHPLFATKVEALAGGERAKPLVLICQAGIQTRALQRKLIESGYRSVAHVRGGVAGLGTDKGWIGYGLPVVESP
jgi:rhodanese-related sulfurtransferase